MDQLVPNRGGGIISNYEQTNRSAVSVIVQSLLNYVNLVNNKLINNFNINQNNVLLLNDNVAASETTYGSVSGSREMFQNLVKSPNLSRMSSKSMDDSVHNDSQSLRLIHEKFITVTADPMTISPLSMGTDNSYNYSSTPSLEETLDPEPILTIIFHFLSKSTNRTEFALFFMLIIFATLTIFGN